MNGRRSCRLETGLHGLILSTFLWVMGNEGDVGWGYFFLINRKITSFVSLLAGTSCGQGCTGGMALGFRLGVEEGIRELRVRCKNGSS